MSLIEKLDAHFRGGVMPPWWLAFADDPAGAVEDLLLGRAALGHLSRAEPAELLLDWLEGLDAGIVAAVDDALAGWIAKSWGVPVLERAADSAALTATAWSRACDVVGSERRLEQAHAALLARVPEDLAFLPSLSAGRSRDPQGRAWLALARRQTDRELIDLWWRLCRLPVEVAWYHGALGVRGLRGLPEEHPGAGGGFPWEAAEGLVRWARALEQRCREGWLEQQKAENEFLRTARLTMWAYNWHDRWTGFWKQHLPFELDLDGMADGWIRQVMPEKLRGASRDARQKRHVQPNRDWSQDAMALAHQLRSPAPATVLEAQSLLDEQQSYAEATGDTEFVVRTACNFASRIRSREPATALEWLRLARRFEPDDAHVWTTEAIVLRDLNDFDAALRTATEAVRRFPYDPVSHTTLAEILRAQGRRREAEWVYGAAAERFPEHAESHAGWAEVVKEQGRLEEAERLYRDAYRRFPDDAAAANGLAGVLCARGRLDEAEEFYQGVLRRDRGDGHARRGLRMVEDARRRAARASSVAETPVPYDASPLFAPLRSDDVEMLLQDAFFLRRWR